MADNVIEVWKELEYLGKGTYGTVIKYKNQATGMLLAVKINSNDNVIEKKNLHKEYSIIKELNHWHIVKYIDVKDFNIDVEKCLTLEFCNRGCLRKTLTNQNFGLEEKQVKMIAHDISSALKYLHGLKIYHRDLKPDNIMLNQNPNERVVHKIIDFGSAQKTLNGLKLGYDGCTFQYLAPEYMEKLIGATPAMDYWSFGTTVFESITGFRPFLPSTSFNKWIEKVKKKSNQDIYMYLDNEHKLKLCNQLPSSCKFYDLTQKDFEQWLRLVLSYNPENRSQVESDGSPSCFHLLDEILNRKILNIFDHKTTSTESLDANNISISTVRQLIHFYNIKHGPSTTNSSTIFFLTSQGFKPRPDKCLNNICSQVDYDSMHDINEKDQVDLFIFNWIKKSYDQSKRSSQFKDSMDHIKKINSNLVETFLALKNYYANYKSSLVKRLNDDSMDDLKMEINSRLLRIDNLSQPQVSVKMDSGYNDKNTLKKESEEYRRSISDLEKAVNELEDYVKKHLDLNRGQGQPRPDI